MIDSYSPCDRGFARPKQIEEEGRSLCRGKGKSEDEEMRSAGRIIRVRGEWESVIK